MPFKSRAQRRKFYADPRLRKYVDEWETDKPLPERVAKQKNAERKEALRRLAKKKGKR